MGSIEHPATYSVSQQARQILTDGILNNVLVPSLPEEIEEAAKNVTFESNNDKPSIPINWRFAESISALKAFEASMLNVLRKRKYGSQYAKVGINTNHASLFVLSPFLASAVDDAGKLQALTVFSGRDNSVDFGFPSTDLHRCAASLHRVLATNIYKTKDGRFYHCHGSMNPDPTITALGLPLDTPPENESYDEVVNRYQETVGKLQSPDLDGMMNRKYRQAGTVAWSSKEFFASEHGKANEHVGLYEILKAEPTGGQPSAGWWPEQSSMPSSAERPLAGLKVVDLCRVIAGPTIGRALAEMGASVMRVTSPYVTDISLLHQDLNWGKWNCSLHLKTESDRERLKQLIRDADVVIEGYRPGVMEKYGLSREDLFTLVKERDRGIIHVRENCYGWHGPWVHRSGWQQISDACCGVSLEYGRAMGRDEAVTPVWPNSDYCTGIIGSVGVLHALMRRAEEGGSFGVDVALNYYSQWLVKSVGTYPPEVWSELWSLHGNLAFRHYHTMGYTIPAMMKSLREKEGARLFDPRFFERRESKAVGHTFEVVKPISAMEGVILGYNVGTRSNGVDKPYWPIDLTAEVVA